MKVLENLMMKISSSSYMPTAIMVMMLALSIVRPTMSDAQTPEPAVLVVAQSVDVDGLEPASINFQAERNVIHHLFATLYEITASGHLEPYLATEYEISEDGREHSFYIPSGRTCQDGSPLTADDAAYSFQRAADPANAFTGNTRQVLEQLLYVDAYALNANDLVIVIDGPPVYALGLIAQVYIHCRESYEGVPLARAMENPVGSGPYRLVEWVHNNYLVMERVPEFTLRPNYFDRIEWWVMTDGGNRVSAMLAGEIDIMSVSGNQRNIFQQNSDIGTQIVSGTRQLYIGFNQRDLWEDTLGGQALQNPMVRLGLQYALDVTAFCDDVLEVPCERATSSVHPLSIPSEITPFSFDPALAEQMLSDAGYPPNDEGIRFELTLQIPTGRSGNDREIAEWIGESFEAVGVAVDVEMPNWTTEYLPRLQEHELGPLFLMYFDTVTWSAPYSLQALARPTLLSNATEWTNPNWARLWPQLLNSRDVEQTDLLTHELLRILHADPPWLSLYFQSQQYAVNQRVVWQARPDGWLIVNDAYLAESE